MLDALLAEHGLDPAHPDAVMDEARHWVAHPGIDSDDLVDLTAMPFVTIDETTSKDLDQAVFIEPFGEGHRVHYAIADASYYVRPGTALYTEALRRGASFYLPGLVIPMLPKVLSEDLISLNPYVDRRALVWSVTLDASGHVRDTRVQRARVHSRAKLAWGEVQGFYDGGDSPAPGLEAELLALKAVGEKRLALAEARHVVHFRRKEVVVHLDDGDGSFVAVSDERLDVERYNEQISLLTNEVGARFLQEDHPDPHPIYRVHEPPSHERLRRLVSHADAVLAAHHMEQWRWKPDEEGLAAWLRRLPRAGEEGRVAQAIHHAAMRSSGRAVFQAEPGRHHGVGAEVYGRFTAPMREIVGVFLHEETVEKLRGAPFPESLGWADGALREAVIHASDAARSLQRELDQEANRLVLDQLFAEDLAAGRARRGTVMEVSQGKAFVQLDDPAIEVKVYRAHLEKHWGERAEAEGVVFRGKTSGAVRLGVGQEVGVEVVCKDEQLDRWELYLTP
ncbi:MAG: RNB domain-containing ribonuclease [Deltaproteobacteria bacterium]|nr:MAG: RNB domain-containing ribonuclease [Deltaproteobacteria bacterium]